MGRPAHGPIRPDGHCDGRSSYRRGLARAVIRDWDRTATYPHAPPPPMAAALPALPMPAPHPGMALVAPVPVPAGLFG